MSFVNKAALTERSKGEPETLVVYGAGDESVNGVYHYSGRFQGKFPSYEMKGTRNGKATTFKIRYFMNHDCWGITDGDSCTLYASNFVENVSTLPFRRGWWHAAGSAKMDCPPIISYDGTKTLDWRNDPEESLADYKIEIRFEHDGQSTTVEYHVHRHILASASNYYARLFTVNKEASKEGLAFVENKGSTCRIELATSIANTFPNFLDYVYQQFSNNGNVHSNIRPTKNTVAPLVYLYWLADYFEVPQLCQDVDDSIERCLTVSSSCKFMSEALEYNVTHIVDTVLKFCSKHLSKLDARHIDELATAFDTSNLLFLLRNKINNVESSRKASELVAAFCAAHEVDAATFATLTDAALLPCLERKAAMTLLEKERVLFGHESVAPSSLQKRCIAVFAKNFGSIDTSIDGPL